VVLAVGGAYLQVVAARARVAAGRAQLETANALYRQSEQRRSVGLVAQVDVGRSQVQALTQQQRLTSLQNDFAKQKINLARMVGLPPTEQYEIGEDISFAPAPALSLDDALRQAQEGRADLKAAQAQVRAAERVRAAAHAQRLPSVTVNADYGAIGGTLPDARGTFSIVGRVRVPIWQGGYAEGEIQQADAAVRQRLAEFDDLSSQIEGDLRKAYLDVDAAASQVEVAVQNQEVARQTLALTRQRFDAGVSDNVEVVQAQESAAVAALDYINSVFAHNLAKLSVARAIGVTADRLADFLKLP
jgi:outer membrane protein TolC